ncbi:MAG: 50S ribosomal protein L4 [Candidatus Saccharimonadales bacterium]
MSATNDKRQTTNGAALSKEIFNVEVKNHELLKLAYDSYLAGSRNAHAKTKERGDVRGGGKKPWKQKGTGRARFGSSRNPIWRGGGIVFGPTGHENFTKKIATSSKRVALRQALSLANKAKKITLIPTFSCPDGKVKATIKLLRDHKVNERARVLLVVSEKDDLVRRATRNVAQVKAVQANYLNVVDILNADVIFMSSKAVAMVETWLAPTKIQNPKSKISSLSTERSAS